MKRLGALLASLLLAGSLTACGGTAAQEMQSIQVFAMDTVMGLRACGGETEIRKPFMTRIWITGMQWRI